MKDLKDIILERRIRKWEIEGKKVPELYLAVFNDYLEEIAESLSDYANQVRNEVCEQIKAEFDTSGFNKIGASLYPPTEEAMWIGKGFNACKERLFNKLDQIQGDKAY